MCVFGSKSVVALTVLAVSVLGFKIFTRDGRELPNMNNYDGYYDGDVSMVITHGEPLELFCEHDDSGPLSITRYNLETKELEPMLVEEWNSTIIRLFLKKPERQLLWYVCQNQEDRFKTTAVIVMVESLPKINNFSCILYGFQILNCTWSSPNIANNYTIFLEDNGRSKNNTLCTIQSRQDNLCLYSFKISDFKFILKLTFLMKACNPLGCVHPRFNMSVYSIVKLDPPKLLQVMSKGSRFAYLKWKLDIPSVLVYHTVEYLCFENEPYAANTEFIIVPSLIREVATNIDLPCANTRYEVRISVKSKIAIGDQYWSEPASISFKTDMDTKPNDDQMCRYPVGSAKGMLNNSISKLKADMQQQLLKLKERVKSLRNRADALNLRRSSDDE